VSDPSTPAVERRLSILVVEDEALVLMSLVDMLGELGHDVLEAGNAAAALSFLRADGPVQLMLTDVNLPDMKGQALANEARTLRPSLPIVFCTGYRMDVPEELARSGPTGVLTKPYWLGELEKALLLAG
jgi:CheY-like chemotaxis protein